MKFDNSYANLCNEFHHPIHSGQVQNKSQLVSSLKLSCNMPASSLATLFCCFRDKRAFRKTKDLGLLPPPPPAEEPAGAQGPSADPPLNVGDGEEEGAAAPGDSSGQADPGPKDAPAASPMDGCTEVTSSGDGPNLADPSDGGKYSFIFASAQSLIIIEISAT